MSACIFCELSYTFRWSVLPIIPWTKQDFEAILGETIHFCHPNDLSLNVCRQAEQKHRKRQRYNGQVTSAPSFLREIVRFVPQVYS